MTDFQEEMDKAAQDAFDSTKVEYDAVNNMIFESMKHGLQVDVIMSFAQHVKDGEDYAAAAWKALYDWDI